MAAFRRVFLSGFTGSGFCLTKYRAFIAIPSSWRRSDGGPRVRLVHPNVFIVHTTTLMRCMKAEGVPSKKARAIISALRKMAHSPAMKYPSIDQNEMISCPKLREALWEWQRLASSPLCELDAYVLGCVMTELVRTNPQHDYVAAIDQCWLHESEEKAAKDLDEMRAVMAESRRKVREILLTLSTVPFIIAGWILLLWERMDRQETSV